MIPGKSPIAEWPPGPNSGRFCAALVARFGELALRLWSTEVNIEYYHIEEYDNASFVLASEEMQAARVMRLAEYDTALNGRPIQVVVQPMIAAFGTPDGKEYQKKGCGLKS
jgi:hypothetical protein